ncbi:MAG: hypothetical protein ACTSYL_02100 [Candidatus Thorarchaeota archaeon]
MSSDEQIRIDGLEKTVAQLTSEVESLKKEMATLSELPKISDAIKTLQTSLVEVKDGLSPITKMNDVVSSLKTIESGITTITKDKSIQSLDKKIDGLASNVQSLDSRLEKIQISDEIAAVDKKVDDVLSSVAGVGKGLQQVRDEISVDALMKKIDELQGYVVGFSNIEEKVQELTSTFDETREIVSIIVRQLDDIERKYNKALGNVSEALKIVQETIASGAASRDATETKPEEPTPSRKQKRKHAPATVSDAALPSTIDSIMEQLLSMVTPHTEAIAMAEALEATRDQLTDLIKEHTPVIFQFGKIARELKSYPPTATLNENDIARLNKEIRTWTTKLKELARG